MRSPSEPALLALLTLGCLLALAGTARAAETASSELVIISEGETVDGDLYATGVRVLIEGVVEGDLVAFAAEEVAISGEVTGSVVAAAPSVTIDGSVGGSVRVAASELDISGVVGGDVVGAVVTGDLVAGSEVSGDVLIWAVDLTVAGSIGQDLRGTQRTLRAEGSVGGDVDVSVGSLIITGPMQVAGDLGYRSGDEAEGLDQVTVGGVLVHKSPVPPNIRVRALGLLGRILTILMLATSAVLVAWGWPERTRRAGGLARTNALRAWGYGAPVMLCPFLLAALGAVSVWIAPASASLPLLAIFIPLVVMAAGIVLVLALVAGVPAVLALGDSLPGKRGAFGSILLGSITVGALWLIPIVGWLVPLLVLPLGLGAWMLSLRRGADAVSASGEPATGPDQPG